MAVTIAETSGHVTETELKSPLSPPVTMRRNDRSHSPKYAPGAPLVHPGMAPLPLGNSTPAPNAWREAHQAVAAFPRGHADILAWEQQSAASPALSPTHTPPATPGGQPHSGPGTQPMRHHMPMHGGKP